jgi:aminopeptidase
MVKGERISWPLMALLERRIIAAGATPDLCLVPPNNERGRVWSATMARGGTDEQLGRVPEWHAERYASMTKYIEILGAEDPASYAGLSAREVQRLAAADRPFKELRLARPWVITLYPTPAAAAMEGLALEDYVALIVRACTADPRPLREVGEPIARRLREARDATVVTFCPRLGRELTLRLGLAGSGARCAHGLHNLPDGEVFTSPDASQVEGEVFLDVPVCYGGEELSGIYLRLEAGRITDCHAEKGLGHLRAIIETDAGSHRLGELALGINPAIQRALRGPLVAEKVGGTLHIAIGASYEECQVEEPESAEGQRRVAERVAAGNLNRSAQHVDLVVDFRPGGCGRRVLLGEREAVVRGGQWVVG